MAGDLQLGETILTGHLPVGASPVPILHEYGHILKIGLSSDGNDTSSEKPLNRDSMSPTERFGYEAFLLRNETGYVNSKSNRPYADYNWDKDPGSAPDSSISNGSVSNSNQGGPLVVQAIAPGTSDRLTGRIAVGLMIVSGHHRLLQFDQIEKVKINADVQNALSWLGAQSPGKDVTFVYDINDISVQTRDVTSGPNYEIFEAPWRDDALHSLGLRSGHNGISDYVSNLKKNLNTDWAFCAFITKYNLYHFAYANIGGPKLVMSYTCGGWGSGNLDRIFAHEVCHIFGAPDEYATSGCNCTQLFGYYQHPNSNCELCADGGGTSCIMRRNTWDMCAHTPFHLGYTMPANIAVSS